MKLHWIFSFSILVVPQSASGAQGLQPLVLSIMYVREVGKLALYVRKKEWLMMMGVGGYEFSSWVAFQFSGRRREFRRKAEFA